MTDGYTEYGYRGLEEIKRLEAENNLMNLVILELKAQLVTSRLGIKSDKSSK